MTHARSKCRALRLPRASLAMLLAIGGCTSVPWQMTPEDRSLAHAPQATAAPPHAAPRATASTDKSPAAVKDSYYRVKPGDTLYRIATDHGQRSEDIVKWNNLPDANHIETGGVLRVTPPADAPAANKNAPPAPATRDDANARSSKNGKNDKNVKAKAAQADSSRFGWPANGTLSAVYGQGKSKGMVIAAKAAAPVKAAAAGRIVFAGDAGKPYGKLIVIKHDDTLVTAYGHNGKLLVKEGATVRRGETIAEMAETAHGEGALRFEVRKNGKPVDPAPYLPRVGS